MKYRKSRQKYRVTTKTNTRTPSKSSSARDLANSNNENVGDYNYYSYDDAVQQKSSSNQVDDNAAAAADDTVATDDATATSTDDATTAATTDDYYSFDDAVVSNDDGKTDNTDDFYTGDNELCSQFLVSFLEGTTDARDTCDGIMNAFVAAECSQSSSYESSRYYDDFFEEFSEHKCCQALMAHHSDYCGQDTLLSNLHLFVAASVLLLCEVAKAFVQRYRLHFLPEAASCILVGTLIGIVAHLTPFGAGMDTLVFDDELFLSLLLPPIIFEAALKVSKKEFKRRRGAIFMFSVFGTIISTFSTGLMVHYASKVSNAQTFPMLDSLVFGALISSIDPVAILSVLTSLHLDQKDTIFILVFGESLLNDGIAITVFQTLVERFDGKTNDGTTSVDEVLDAIATFLIAMFGSLAVGLACGCGALAYFSLLGRSLPPVMEVGSFFLWALIPYYICDGVGWSGIVSIVAVGFFMDVYIAGPKNMQQSDEQSASTTSNTVRSSPPRSIISRRNVTSTMTMPVNDSYMNMNVEMKHTASFGMQSVAPLPTTERIRLSAEADRHVRFVAHLTSQLAENAIFAYIGLFLFSSTYDWNPTLMTIAVVSCVSCRAIMVVSVSYVIARVYGCRGQILGQSKSHSRTALAIRDKRTQAVLVLAGLRGAVSLALVENVPIYNSMTGEGCEFKQLMKGMTSASILFTTFVFGGGSYYILPHLGISPEDSSDAAEPSEPERSVSPLSSQHRDSELT
jgi:NhaP-type Na+/H+ or K+/H+ antiporter